MIEIIKKPEKRKYKMNCHCGCEFTFQDEDKGFERIFFASSNNSIDKEFIVCPNCYEELDLKVWHFEEEQ